MTARGRPVNQARFARHTHGLRSAGAEAYRFFWGHFPQPNRHLSQPAMEKWEQMAVKAQQSCRVHTTGIRCFLIYRNSRGRLI